MNENIQATITLTLTREQLMTLLTTAPSIQTTVLAAPQTPSSVQMPVQTSAPTVPQMPVQQTPAPVQNVQTSIPTMPAQQTPAPVQPTPQAPTMPTFAPQGHWEADASGGSPLPAQTAPRTYTVEQLGLAARPLMESGRQQELAALLTEFGVQSVAALPEDRRADFAARLRAMGGQI